MDIYTATIIISIVIFVAIGNYSGRSVKELDVWRFLYVAVYSEKAVRSNL